MSEKHSKIFFRVFSMCEILRKYLTDYKIGRRNSIKILYKY